MKQRPVTQTIALISWLAAFLYPALALATRGEDDTGIILVFVVMSLPFDLAILGLIIYSIVRLKNKAAPKPGQGKVVFVFSVIVAALAVIAPLALMYSAEWYIRMVQAALAVFVPILVLALVSTALASRVKRKART